MTKPIEIVFLHGSLGASEDEDRIISEQVSGLRERGHRVQLYSTSVRRLRNAFGRLSFGWPRRMFPLLSPLSAAPTPLSMLVAALLTPINAARMREADVFVGWDEAGSWLAYLITRWIQRPYVLFRSGVSSAPGKRERAGHRGFSNGLQNLGWRGLPARLLGDLERNAVESATVVLANGGAVADWIHAEYGREATVCAAGCWPHSRRVLRLDTPYVYDGAFKLDGRVIEKPYLLVAGEFGSLGQLEIVFRLLAQVTQVVPGAFLVLAGKQADDAAEVDRIARQQFVDDRCLITGELPEPDLQRLFREAAVYCHLAPDDGSALAVLEAMAWAVPVVAWNQVTTRSIVENGNTGFLAEAGNVAVFAKAVAWLLQDPELRWRLGAAGWDRAQRYFTWEHHLDVLEGALVNAVSEGDRAGSVDSLSSQELPLPSHSSVELAYEPTAERMAEAETGPLAAR